MCFILSRSSCSIILNVLMYNLSTLLGSWRTLSHDSYSIQRGIFLSRTIWEEMALFSSSERTSVSAIDKVRPGHPSANQKGKVGWAVVSSIKPISDGCTPTHPTSMGNTNSVPSTSQRQIPKIKFRVLIIGRANAGKTSILQRVCDTTDSPVVYRGDEEVCSLTFVPRPIRSYSLPG